MLSTRSLVSSAVGLAVLASGCGAQTGSDLVVSSDPQLGALAAELLPDLAARSGMELTRPVRLESRSREELTRYLNAKLDEDLPEEEARVRSQAYALLGLVPEGLDLRGLLLELYGEQVAGFYEPDSTALYVMDDQPAQALEALLVHELVHAVQDQSTELRALTDPEVGNDRSTAAMAVIEGHATLVMFEYLTEQMTGAAVDLGTIPDFAAQVGPALEAMSTQFPALAGAPRVIRESLVFPYVQGAGYVQGLWTGGERTDPFGDALPLSTEQVLRPGAEPPVELRLGVDEGTPLLDDTLGRLELGILLEDVAGLGPGEAGALADGWDGDRWVLVEDARGIPGMAYMVLWEDEARRDRFLAAVEARPEGFGGAVSVQALSVAGRPASLLRVGSADFAVEARLSGGS